MSSGYHGGPSGSRRTSSATQRRRRPRRSWPRPGSTRERRADRRPASWREHLVGRGDVDLVDHDDGVAREPARRRSGRPGRCGAVASTTRHTTSTPAEAPVGRGVEPLAQRVRGLWMPGRVDEHDLARRPPDVQHRRRARRAPGARRLGLVRDDRHLGAEDGVQQRRLADVGPTDQRARSRTHGSPRRRASPDSSPPTDRRASASAIATMRTRAMRRPCTCSATQP